MYQLNAYGVLRLADGAHIPLAPGNRDYQEYLAWVATGATPLPAPAVDWREPVMADFRTRREVYLNRLGGVAAFEGDGNATIKSAAATFRQRLLDLPANPTLSAATSASALQSAIVALYKAAVAEAVTAAPAAKTAFDRIAK